TALGVGLAAHGRQRRAKRRQPCHRTIPAGRRPAGACPPGALGGRRRPAARHPCRQPRAALRLPAIHRFFQRCPLMIHAINPATEQRIASYDLHTSAQVEQKLANAAKAQKSWALKPVEERASLLLSLAAA